MPEIQIRNLVEVEIDVMMDRGPNESPARFLALGLATVGFAVCFAVWGLIAPLVPQFQETMRLTGTQASVLVAVPVLLGSIARIPIGMLTDHWGGRTVFSLLLLFLVVPLAFIGFSTSYWALVFWGFWLGLAGSSFAIGVPFVSRWFSASQQGLALGIYGMGNIGTAVANFVAPNLAANYGWAFVFRLFIIPVVLMAALFWLLGRDAPVRTRARSFSEQIELLRNRPQAWVLSLFYFVTFGGFVAMSLYLPTFLVTGYGVAKADAALSAAAFVVVATLARPLGGYLADRIKAATLLNVVFLVIALLAIVLAFQPDIVGITVALLGSAFVLGMGNGAVFKLVAEQFPRDTGAISGIVGAAGGLGGFFPPILMGLVHDATGGYAIGFMLLSEFGLICLIVNVLVLQGHAQTFGSGDRK